MLLIGFRSASGGLTVVSAANPLPVTGGGGGGGGAVTAAAGSYADGSIVVLGSTADAAWDGSTPNPTISATLQGVYGELALSDLKLGELSDPMWDGTGNPASLIALWKRLASTDPVLVTPTGAEYETVAAGVTDQMGGAGGAVGDTITGILVVPTATTVGAISIEDGSTNTQVYAGGTVGADLKPFFIPLFDIATVNGGWEITTGVAATCIIFGRFT